MGQRDLSSLEEVKIRVLVVNWILVLLTEVRHTNRDYQVEVNLPYYRKLVLEDPNS